MSHNPSSAAGVRLVPKASSLPPLMYGTANRLHPYCVRLTEGKAGSSGFPGGFYGGAGQEEAFPLNGGGLRGIDPPARRPRSYQDRTKTVNDQVRT